MLLILINTLGDRDSQRIFRRSSHIVIKMGYFALYHEIERWQHFRARVLTNLNYRPPITEEQHPALYSHHTLQITLFSLLSATVIQFKMTKQQKEDILAKVI